MNELSLNNALIHTKDIINKFSNERSMNQTLKNYMDKKYIEKIKNGLYAVINPLDGFIFANRFEIASALYPNACIAYHSALEYYGLANQVTSEVHIYTDNRYMPFIFSDVTYRSMPSKFNDGIISHEYNSIIRVTNLERTVVDCIDRINVAGGLDEVVMALSAIAHLDEKLILKYLKEYNEKLLFKKAGFLLSLTCKDILTQDFFDECHKNISDKTDNICENKMISKKSDKFWRIVYPKDLVNTVI